MLFSLVHENWPWKVGDGLYIVVIVTRLDTSHSQGLEFLARVYIVTCERILKLYPSLHVQKDADEPEALVRSFTTAKSSQRLLRA